MGVSDIEHKKYVGQVSSIIRALTSKDEDLLPHFDKTVEAQAEINITSCKHLLVDNHDVAASISKIRGKIPREFLFGFCGTFKKITKHL